MIHFGRKRGTLLRQCGKEKNSIAETMMYLLGGRHGEKGFALSLSAPSYRLNARSRNNAVPIIARFFIKPLDGTPNEVAVGCPMGGQQPDQLSDAVGCRPFLFGHARPN